MSLFEICVLAGIVLHLFFLVWVLSHTNRMLTLINEKLFDILSTNRNINGNAYNIATLVNEARQEAKRRY